MEGDGRQIASTAEDSANSRSFCVLWRFSSEMVGATGFEPATPCAQGRCATRLRYAPTRSILPPRPRSRRRLQRRAVRDAPAGSDADVDDERIEARRAELDEVHAWRDD